MSTEPTVEHIANQLDWDDLEWTTAIRDGWIIGSRKRVAKIYLRNIPRATNAAAALRALDGRSAPIFHDLHKTSEFTALVMECCDPATEVDAVGLARTLSLVHDVEQPSQVKYTSDPLALPDRLLRQLRVPESLIAAEYFNAIAGRISSVSFDRRCLVHRDLVKRNVMQRSGRLIFVDWDHAAFAPVAWDFAKLQRWHPITEPFLSNYSGELPTADDIEWFAAYDAFSEWCRWPDDSALRVQVERAIDQLGCSPVREL